MPVNKEKYISFTKHTESKVNLKFIDSFRFMSSSLDKLASYLPEDQKHITRKFYSDDNDKFHLLQRKGIFPYEYLNNWQNLQEKTLPNIEAFYSNVNRKALSKSDYDHAWKIWNKFNIKML